MSTEVISIPFTALLIRHDASFTHPVAIPAHERPFLEYIFGRENVSEDEANAAAVAAARASLDPTTERERLGNKYGHVTVEQIFGTNPTAIEQAMQAAAATVAKPVRTRRKAAEAEAAEPTHNDGEPIAAEA